jgi:hypothetical protein
LCNLSVSFVTARLHKDYRNITQRPELAVLRQYSKMGKSLILQDKNALQTGINPIQITETITPKFEIVIRWVPG